MPLSAAAGGCGGHGANTPRAGVVFDLCPRRFSLALSPHHSGQRHAAAAAAAAAASDALLTIYSAALRCDIVLTMLILS